MYIVVSHLKMSCRVLALVHMHKTELRAMKIKLEKLDEWVFEIFLEKKKERLPGTEFPFAHWLKQNTQGCIADSYKDKHEESIDKQ